MALDPKIADYQAGLNKQQLSLQKYKSDIERAESTLPTERGKVAQALTQAKDNVRKLHEMRGKEAGQADDVDRQVRTQREKIRESALKLTKQARDERIKVGKWYQAALANRTLSVESHHYAVRMWWEGVFEAMRERDRSGNATIQSAMTRASRAMQKALLGEPVRRSKPVLPTPASQAESFPNQREIADADKRIGKVEEARDKLERQVGEQKGKIAGAEHDLEKRRLDAYEKIKGAVAQRDAQIKEWTGRVDQLNEADRDLDKRAQELIKARGDAAQRGSILARNRDQLTRALRRQP